MNEGQVPVGATADGVSTASVASPRDRRSRAPLGGPAGARWTADRECIRADVVFDLLPGDPRRQRISPVIAGTQKSHLAGILHLNREPGLT
jgi:hypothetical protein